MKLARISSGSGFNPENLVTSCEIFTRKSEIVYDDGVKYEQKKFADDGLFSPRIFGDMDSKEEYSCECGKLHGKFYEGKVCPKCGKPVKFVGMTIDKSGWIDLSRNEYNADGTVSKVGNGFHVIMYVAYSQLEKVIGKENLRNIIQVRNTITVAGDIDTTELDEIRSQSPKNKYYFIGIEGFYKQYDEVLDYYYQLNNRDDERLYQYLKDKDAVFTDKIPVISIILRPAMRTADGLKLDEINIRYQGILKNLEILKDPNIIQIIRDLTIEQIQAEYMQLNEEILDSIKSKEGLIRKQICGTRINFSARNIISPAKAGYKMDEIVRPYLTFLELYRFELISTIKKIKNISFKEAENIWYNATLKMDEEVYKVMEEMISTHEVGVLLNRNPTISFQSIVYLRVAGIKHDYNDNTLSIHNCILSGLAADYDGDVLNLVSIKDEETKKVFKETFSPIHFIIDPNTGDFNDSLNLEKDQVLGINNLMH